MNRTLAILAITPGLAAALPARATGLAACDSDPTSGGQAAETLEQQLVGQGWTVRRIEEDGGCDAVDALDATGRRIEADFHPVTLASASTRR